ncbi:MAG TPA: hypothetical protein ENH05_01420 [Rhizobiales bacterium]|nr:hypothetical protein [Hyphomicrobiales bacterium]
MRTRMRVQIVGVVFFAIITIGEASGLLKPSFAIPMGWTIYAFAGAVMAFLAWRTWRKMKAETETNLNSNT